MKTNCIKIAGSEYRTKAALAEACRSIISQARDNLPLPENHIRFVTELFERHPEYLEKSSPGIAGFSVATDSRWGTTRHFIVQRIDGTSIDFSWKICIDGKLPERRINVLAAMRTAIANQILTFRQVSIKTGCQCPITGQSLSENNCHIDHSFPRTFLTLANEWLIEVGKSFKQIELVRSMDGYGWNLSDSEQTASWQSFHRSNASLRAVSPRANLSDLKRKHEN